MHIYYKIVSLFVYYICVSKNIFFLKKKTYAWSVMGIFCIFILTTCTHNNLSQTSYDCKMNKIDYLKYSDNFNENLFTLKIPKELKITLPNIDPKYHIPSINSIKNYNLADIDENINIHPPMIFKDIFHESCLINFD